MFHPGHPKSMKRQHATYHRQGKIITPLQHLKREQRINWVFTGIELLRSFNQGECQQFSEKPNLYLTQ